MFYCLIAKSAHHNFIGVASIVFSFLKCLLVDLFSMYLISQCRSPDILKKISYCCVFMQVQKMKLKDTVP